MKDKYIQWVKEHYPDRASSLDQCSIAVRNITMQYPELIVQVGYANGIYHCWTKDTNGFIIDPTANQFVPPIEYKVIANRFLDKAEIELSTGAIFLNDYPECEKGD